MPGMKLVADPSLRATSGSFGAKVENGELRLPPEAYRFAKWSGAETAEDLVAEVQSYAGVVMASFTWSPAQYAEAVDELKAALRGHVPAAGLGPPPPPFVRGMGALGGAPPPDYAEAFGEIEAKPVPAEEPVREDEPKVVVDGAPSVDGFEE